MKRTCSISTMMVLDNLLCEVHATILPCINSNLIVNYNLPTILLKWP